MPTAAQATRRVPCSACGLSKRHLFDTAARDGGYDVVATGHNLDDEAAVLLGNTLRWDIDYLARQLPVLPGGDGFPQKVKPLVRLTERETAAWCIVRGIDYQVEECPMAAGNKHLGYKAALNALEAASPGSKAAFYLGFLERMAPLLAGRSRAAVEGAAARAPRAARRRPARCARSAGSSRRRRRTTPVPVEMHRVTGRRCSATSMSRPLRVRRAGAAARRQAAALPRRARREGGEFHSHAGFVAHADLVGRPEGVVVRSTKGAEYTALRPTLEDFVVEMPRGAQVIYPKDLAPICMLADIGPGVRVLRDRRRLGRAVDDDAALGRRDRRLRAARGLRQPGAATTCAASSARRRWRATGSSCATATTASTSDGRSTGWCSTCPSRGRSSRTPRAALRPAGSSSPTRRRSCRRRRSARRCRGSWIDARTLEVLHRGWHIEGAGVRPDHRMVAHTGFLTVARFLGR